MTMENPHWSRKQCILFGLNALAIAVIITPLSITLWWSTWGLFYNFANLISSNNYPHIGLWFLIAFGSLGKFIMFLLQFLLRHYMNSEKRGWLSIAITMRVELYIKFILNMAYWVGVWTLLDILTGVNGIMISLALSGLGLLTLRSLNAGLATPMNLDLDFNQKPFHHYTRFKNDPYNYEHAMCGLLLYTADCILTIPIIDALLVVYWRSGFYILNLHVLPQDPKLSAWITIIIGYIMYLAFLYLQFPVVRISQKFTSFWKRSLWKACYWRIAFIMMVFIWRGIWNVLDLYAPLGNLPNPYNYVAPIIIHICIAAIMFLLNIFCNNIPGFGVVDDACLDGRDLLTINILPTVSDFVITYATRGRDTQEQNGSPPITISQQVHDLQVVSSTVS